MSKCFKYQKIIIASIVAVICFIWLILKVRFVLSTILIIFLAGIIYIFYLVRLIKKLELNEFFFPPWLYPSMCSFCLVVTFNPLLAIFFLLSYTFIEFFLRFKYKFFIISLFPYFAFQFIYSNRAQLIEYINVNKKTGGINWGASHSTIRQEALLFLISVMMIFVIINLLVSLFTGIRKSNKKVSMNTKSIELNKFDYSNAVSLYVFPLVTLSLTDTNKILFLFFYLSFLCVMEINSGKFQNNITLLFFGLKTYEVSFCNNSKNKRNIVLSLEPLSNNTDIDCLFKVYSDIHLDLYIKEIVPIKTKKKLNLKRKFKSKYRLIKRSLKNNSIQQGEGNEEC